MNKAIAKLLDEHPEWRRGLKIAKEYLCDEEHFHVLDDLVDFTGLDVDEVAFRVMKKYPTRCAARGWFFEEWDYHDPSSQREIDWFYKCASSYLFSSARKVYWEPLEKFLNPKEHKVILDYGCGIGTNVLGFMGRGFNCVVYYDISILQQKFVEFRVAKRGGHALSWTDAWSDDHPTYCAITLHDVLEHVPGYERLLVRLIDLLRPGGIIVERSAFGERKKMPVHLPEKVPIEVAMCGMKRIGGDRKTARVWRKI